MSGLPLLPFFTVICAVQIGAQPIETDRPDQTETSWTIPERRLQVEAGYAREWQADRDAVLIAPTSSSIGALMRFAVFEGFELRGYGARIRVEPGTVVPTVQPGPGPHRPEEQTVSGIGDVAVGTKVAVVREAGFLPETSIIAHVTLPIGASAFRPSRLTPDVRGSFSHTFAEDLSLGYNLGISWGNGFEAPSFVYTLALGHDLTHRIGAYAELFGIVPSDGPSQTAIDGGLTWGAANHLQIDATIGLIMSSPAFLTAGTGVSIRLPQ